jgi:hypothetical protein
MILQQISAHISEPVKHLIDTLAVGTLVAYFITTVIPAATVGLTFIWVALRVAEAFLSLKLKHLEYRNRK